MSTSDKQTPRDATLDDEFIVDALRYDAPTQAVYALPAGAAWEPATLDLEERARLALNHLTRNLDANLGYLPYFWSHLTSDPPEARHEAYDFGDITGRYVDALILARHMTGATVGEAEEAALKRRLVSMFGDDGLSYRDATSFSRPDAVMFDQSSVLIALVTWWQQTGDPDVRARLDHMIETLWQIADKSTGSCRFPINTYTRAAGFGRGVGGMIDQDAPYFTAGRFMLPLARYLELGGGSQTRPLAEGIRRWIVDETAAFGPDGSFFDHMHSHTSTIIGVLKLGLVTGNTQWIGWGKMAFDWVQHRTGSASFGWYVEDVWPNNLLGADCESCAIVDMLDMAIMLAEGGYPEYWDVAERIARNHLIEAQLTDIGWLQWTKNRPDNDVSSFYQVLPRVLGGFAGWSGPHDFYGHNRVRRGNLMNCCSGAGPHGLYLAWEHALAHTARGVTVELAINRSTAAADVRSFEPFEGKVEVRMHVDAPLRVRIPDWVERSQVSVKREGSEVQLDWQDAYTVVADARAGQVFAVAYPMREWQAAETIGGRNYTISWRGNTVTAIDPAGVRYPLYQRAHLRADHAPLRLANIHRPTPEIRFW